MTQLNSKDLRRQARQTLQAVDTRPIIALYVGVSVLLSLVINGLNVYLDHQISGTGGLAGLGTRSVLETIQQMLSYVSMLFSPFWQAGFMSTMIVALRTQQADPSRMLDGCGRFSKVLSHTALNMLIVFGVSLAVANAASYLFTLTPLSNELNAILLPILESGDLSSLPIEAMMEAMVPLFLIFGAIFIPVYIFIQYLLRLSLYLLMEGAPRGAFQSMSLSTRKMKGYKWQMLQLDLSFWWFYLLDGLLVVVCYLDVILPTLGIQLPINETVAYFATLILYGVLQMALHLWKRGEVMLTYLHAYEVICQETETV